MKRKKIIKYIFDEVYRRDLLFIAGCPLKEAYKELKKYDINPEIFDEEPNGLGMWLSKSEYPKLSSGTSLFIWVKNRKDFYTIVHEVTHLCIKVFELSNMNIDENTTEAFAFYHEFWVKKLWRIMSQK